MLKLLAKHLSGNTYQILRRKQMDELEDIMTEALDGIIYCRECGNMIEPDCPECSCGWRNPIYEMGMI